MELGIGTGMNLPYYGTGVAQVVGLDPCVKLLAMTERSEHPRRQPVIFLRSSAEEIPLEDGSIDTVVRLYPPALAALVREPGRNV